MKVMLSRGMEELVGGSIFAKFVWTSVGVGERRMGDSVGVGDRRMGDGVLCRCRYRKRC